MNEETPTVETQPAANMPLAIVDRMGRVFEVTPEGAQEAISSGAWRLETPEEASQRAAEKEFQGRPFAAAAAGLARGATLGLSDVALAESGIVPGETLKGLKEFNPGASIAGDIAGMVIPGIVTGGTSFAAKGASVLPSALVSNLGKKTAEALSKKAAAQLAGTGLNAGAQTIVKKMAALGIAGGVEGALYGAGQAVSEQALDAPPGYVAESLMSEEGMQKIMSGAMKGGLWGLGAGVAVTGATSAAAPVTRAAVKRLEKLTGEWFEKEYWAVKHVTGNYKKHFKEVGKFAKYSDDAIDNAISTGKLSALDENLPGIKQLGKELMEEGVVPENISGISLSDSNRIASQKVKEWGERIGEVIAAADDAAEASGKKPNITDLKKTIYKNVINPLAKKKIPDYARAADRLTELVESRFDDEITNLKALHEARRDIDDLVKFGKLDQTNQLYNRNLFKVRSEIERFLERNVDELTKGTGVESQYLNAKRKYSAMRWAQDASANRLESEAANRFVSLSDQFWGGVFGGGAAAIRGFDPGTLAIGILAGLGNRALRKRGPAMMAGTLSKMNALGNLNNFSLKSSSRIEKAVKDLLQSSPTKWTAPTAIKLGVLDMGKEKEEGSDLDQLIRIAGHESNIDENIETYLSALGEVAPETAFVLSNNLANTVQFLKERAPKEDLETQEPFAAYESEPSDQEKAKWRRYKEAVNNPIKALEEAKDTGLSPEFVETIKAVYPSLYEKMKQVMVDELGNKKGKPPPYQTRVMLSNLFEIAIEPTLSPASISSLQASFQTSQPQAGNVPRQSRGSAGSMPNVVLPPSNITRATMR